MGHTGFGAMPGLEFLAALCPLLPPGPIVSIAPPHSPLGALMDLLGAPADDRLRQLPVSFLSSPGFAFGQFDLDVLLDVGDRPLLVGAHDGEVVAPRGRLMRTATLDRCYDNLHSCSALELRVVGEPAPLLRGGLGLIARCRPVVVLGGVSATTDLSASAALLRELDYVLVDARLREVEGPHAEGDLVAALPLAADRTLAMWRGAIAGAPSELRRAPLAVQVAALRRAHLADPLQGWSAHVPAAGMITDARRRAHTPDGTAVRWTGPRRDARLLFHVPAPGPYRLEIEVVDTVADEELGPPRIVGRPRIEGTEVGPQRCLAVDTPVYSAEMLTGCAQSLVAPATRFRTIAGRWSNVGFAVAGFDLRRL